MTAVPAALPDVGCRQDQLGYFPSGATTSGKSILRSRDILCWDCFGLIQIYWLVYSNITF